MTPVALLILALCTAAPARADDGPTPVEVEAGESLNLCAAGLAHCPASAFQCDDPSVARIENGPDGVELRGVSPGATICSVFGFERTFRRVLRVTVKRPEPSGADGPAR